MKQEKVKYKQAPMLMDNYFSGWSSISVKWVVVLSSPTHVGPNQGFEWKEYTSDI